MVNWLIEKGVSGLYPNGSTGEFIRLSLEERKRVIQIVAEENRGRVPILGGAAEANLDLILDVCRAYADLGCAAVSVTGPYYFEVSQASIEHFFRELAKRSPIDIVLYNIPQFSNEISVPVVTRLIATLAPVYAPANAAYSLVNLQAALTGMTSTQNTEVQKQGELAAARDTANTNEWAFHNKALEAKKQVAAQYGSDSDQLQAIGLK